MEAFPTSCPSLTIDRRGSTGTVRPLPHRSAGNRHNSTKSAEPDGNALIALQREYHEKPVECQRVTHARSAYRAATRRFPPHRRQLPPGLGLNCFSNLSGTSFHASASSG